MTSEFHSQETEPLECHGLKPTDVLRWLHKHGPSMTKSQLSRQYADEIALCASRGWLSVILPNGEVGRHWRLTPIGLAYLHQQETE